MKALLLAALLCPSLAAAGAVRAELLSSRTTAAPAETFNAGLRLVHKPGWHTYWLNPGDSGMATRLDWRLPPGWSAKPFVWPAPQRIVAPPLTSFGYGGDLVLPLELTAPSTPGRALLRATAEWLECAEVCVPGKAVLNLPVTVGLPSRESPDGPRLRAAFDALPRGGPAVSARREDGAVVLVIPGRWPGAEFFPWQPLFEGGSGPVAVGPGRTELSVTLSPGAAAPSELSGVLVRPGEPPVVVAAKVRPGLAALRHLLFAFLGGLLLNLMPCVFPVLSLKVLGLLQRAGGSAAAARGHAAAYAAGVIVAFELLAAALLAARAAGASLGWGFHLQSAPVVAALALLCVLVGLNLLGLFEVGTRLMGIGARASGGSFFSGVFAVVVAAPCTAPFMGAALGWALTRPAPETLAVFGALGAGTAAPFALLASWPALLKRLPRPGAWMETLKKALSVPMFLTALWLLWVLARLLAPAPAADALWKTWSPEAVTASRAAGRTAFVDFTAAWCLSCQVNERVVLSRPEVKAALARGDAFKADWTDRDPAIAAELAAHGRSGVPLYIVYRKGGEPVSLPEILTPKIVLDALGEP
ncbi:MAG: protein-disulfide reductase DsbD family protein [Elusimicrobiota bacterium]|nr:protein-disulfide reductase DsbD family protein [Elusimicrobiota bacterium]